jgi:hypothetical protein
MRAAPVLAALLSAVALVAGCSSSDGPKDRHGDVNFLAGCGPVDPALIAKVTRTRDLSAQTHSAICGWRGADLVDGHTVDITYGWLENDTLMNEAAVDTRLGYTIDHFVVKHFGGIYLRDPHDPGSCGVSAYDTGTVTWWVANRTHLPEPAPCPAALLLLANTLGIDGV